LRPGIVAGGGFNVRSDRNCCQIENIKYKLTTKSHIETRLPEQKYSDAKSRCLNVPLAAILMFTPFYCPTLMFKFGNSTCNFTFAFNAVKTLIKVSIVALLALLSSLQI